MSKKYFDPNAYINEESKRNVFFSKRRKLIVKKIMEFGKMCDVNIYFAVFNREK